MMGLDGDWGDCSRGLSRFREDLEWKRMPE